MWTIRPETPQDAAAIRDVHLRAFAPERTEADLVEALRAGDAYVPELYLVALDGEAVAGHIAFSRAHLDSGHPVLALAPVGVVPERQRRGAGSALVREGMRRAAETEFGLVVVLGHAAYYPRFGFEPAEPLGVRAPFPVQAEAWMAHRLPAYRREARGTVVYPQAFSEAPASDV